MKAGKPETIDEYLATLSEEKRAGLESLRQQIGAAAPELEECISYGIPSYRYKGKFIMSFGAAAKHLAFYPGAHPVDALSEKLSGFGTSKGAVRFTVAKPLPEELVREIVRVRVEEYAAK